MQTTHLGEAPTKRSPIHKNKIQSINIAVIYNLKRIQPKGNGDCDAEAEFDNASTIAAICDAIKNMGYKVIALEATAQLPGLLTQTKIDIAFNIAEGIGGRTRESQIPALLDLLGIEYTASDATTMSVTLDKILAKRIIKQAGILTPHFLQMSTGKEKIPHDLRFPLIIKPIAEGSSKGIFKDNVVHDESALRQRVAFFIAKHKKPLLVEEYIKGRELTVGLLGEKRPKALPPMEVTFLNKDEPCPVYSFDLKLSFNEHIRYDVPAKLSPSLKLKVDKTAKACFHALGCRDVARIDMRIDAEENIYFLECNPIPGLSPGWSDICLIAEGAGMSYQELIHEILTPALKRWQLRQRQQLELT